jgi:hypothetical protein
VNERVGKSKSKSRFKSRELVEGVWQGGVMWENHFDMWGSFPGAGNRTRGIQDQDRKL